MMKKNKILFVSNTANFSKFNQPLIKWCIDNGWQVDYCAPNDETILNCNMHYVVPIPRNPFNLNIIKSIYLLKKIIATERYDIIHCHTPVGAVVSRLAAKSLYLKHKIRVIYTAHGFHFYKGAPLKYWLFFYPIEKYLSKYTNTLITINEEDYKLAKNKFKTEKIVHIDGVGVDFTRFSPINNSEKSLLRKQYGFDDNDFILLYTAEFIPRKNHKLLFEIIPKIRQQIPNLKVILSGRGKLFDHYKTFVNDNHYEDIVIFTGYTNHINDYCRVSDLLVSTSLQEGLPISMIEAIGTGLPVVCSKIRGHVDVITNSYNGYLCSLNNPNEFADKIIELYKEEKKRKEMSKSALDVAKKYDVSIAVKKISNIYKEQLYFLSK